MDKQRDFFFCLAAVTLDYYQQQLNTVLRSQNGHQSVNEMKSLVHSAADAKRMQEGLAQKLTGGRRLAGNQAKAVAAGNCSERTK